MCVEDFRPQILGECSWIRQANPPPMNYSERGSRRSAFHGAWLCITKAGAGYLRSTAVSSSIIEVAPFVSVFVPHVAKMWRMGSLSRQCCKRCLFMPGSASRQAEKSLNTGGKCGSLWRLQTRKRMKRKPQKKTINLPLRMSSGIKEHLSRGVPLNLPLKT